MAVDKNAKRIYYCGLLTTQRSVMALWMWACASLHISIIIYILVGAARSKYLAFCMLPDESFINTLAYGSVFGTNPSVCITVMYALL